MGEHEQYQGTKGSVGPQGAIKQVTETVDVFELILTGNLEKKLLKRLIDKPSSFYRGVNYEAIHTLRRRNL
jgi:hypothetical protein